MAMRQALTEAGNPDLTIIIRPDTNHAFQAAVTGSLSEQARLGSRVRARFP